MAQPSRGLVENLIVNYRWVFVCFFLLPMSFFFDMVMYVRNWLVFRMRTAPGQHEAKVRNVQRQVLEWNKSGRKLKLCTARPGWQTICFRRPVYKDKLFKVEVNLVDILNIDTERQVVNVEPMVTMGELSARLIPLGLTLPVLPELDDLTVGGLIMGTGIETTSHRYGLFQHICVSFELVLADGSVVKCSREEDPDLFYAVPWSYGTLGILTSAEIRVIPAKKYVRLSYRPIKGFEEFAEEFRKVSTYDDQEFVEGIVFGMNEGVVMTGSLVDTPEHNKVNAVCGWHKPWFFTHVEDILKGGNPVTEYIPLRDYYHRHSRSIFWELRDIIPFGNNVMFRWLLGWMLPPKISLLKLTQTEATRKLYESNHVIQDMLVPITYMEKCLKGIHAAFNVYPLWLCPFKLPVDPGMVHPVGNTPEMYVDIGVYGVPKATGFEAMKSTRAVEALVSDCKGFQMMYADTYTTREEFRRMFDHTLYDRVRARLRCADAFPEVYDKVSKEARR